MKQVAFIFLLLAGIVFSCHKEGQGESVGMPYTPLETANNYLRHLHELDGLNQIEQLDIDPNRLYESIQYPLLELRDAQLLKAYYLACEQKKKAMSRDGLSPSIFITAQEAILLQLSALGTAAAAETLVDLYSNRELVFEAALIISLGEAMIACGDQIVVPLEKVKSVRPIISHRVLECIVTGRAFL